MVQALLVPCPLLPTAASPTASPNLPNAGSTGRSGRKDCSFLFPMQMTECYSSICGSGSSDSRWECCAFVAAVGAAVAAAVAAALACCLFSVQWPLLLTLLVQSLI